MWAEPVCGRGLEAALPICKRFGSEDHAGESMKV